MAKQIHLTLEETDIYKALDGIINHQNKEELIKLLAPLIGTNATASNHFIKLLLNGKLPGTLPVNAPCYVRINALSWSTDKNKMIASKYNNGNNEVPCIIKEFRGHHEAYPYWVEFIRIDANGLETKDTVSVREADLMVIEEF